MKYANCCYAQHFCKMWSKITFSVHNFISDIFFFSKIGNIRILIASGSWVWLTRSRPITLHESRYNKNAKTWHTRWTRWWCINYNLDKNQYMPQICLKKCPRFDNISKTFIHQWVTHWLSNTDPGDASASKKVKILMKNVFHVSHGGWNGLRFVLFTFLLNLCCFLF